ncbi:5-bromo-4-chloroindolyl phosphate hydrolysis family protein, partial [Bacillus sp. WP8]|uniref:5-bromo-4-chloroindolyl phosphate hydrolysis family protein n=1 Tax=Bacillus sp. WP8 TaxID=756828 RepID=UPI0021B43C5E
MKEDLKEGGEKVVGLKKGLFGVKKVERMKDNYEIVRVGGGMYRIRKKEGSGFYDGEDFYLERLDCVVEVSEKYAVLYNQR